MSRSALNLVFLSVAVVVLAANPADAFFDKIKEALGGLKGGGGNNNHNHYSRPAMNTAWKPMTTTSYSKPMTTMSYSKPMKMTYRQPMRMMTYRRPTYQQQDSGFMKPDIGAIKSGIIGAKKKIVGKIVRPILAIKNKKLGFLKSLIEKKMGFISALSGKFEDNTRQQQSHSYRRPMMMMNGWD